MVPTTNPTIIMHPAAIGPIKDIGSHAGTAGPLNFGYDVSFEGVSATAEQIADAITAVQSYGEISAWVVDGSTVLVSSQLYGDALAGVLLMAFDNFVENGYGISEEAQPLIPVEFYPGVVLWRLGPDRIAIRLRTTGDQPYAVDATAVREALRRQDLVLADEADAPQDVIFVDVRDREPTGVLILAHVALHDAVPVDEADATGPSDDAIEEAVRAIFNRGATARVTMQPHGGSYYTLCLHGLSVNPVVFRQEVNEGMPNVRVSPILGRPYDVKIEYLGRAGGPQERAETLSGLLGAVLSRQLGMNVAIVLDKHDHRRWTDGRVLDGFRGRMAELLLQLRHDRQLRVETAERAVAAVSMAYVLVLILRQARHQRD